MNRYSILVGALLLTAGVSGICVADEPRGAQFKEQLAARFAKADVNGDGHLTREEAQPGMPRIYQHFDEINANKNGYLTLQDIQAFMMARAAARHGNQP